MLDRPFHRKIHLMPLSQKPAPPHLDDEAAEFDQMPGAFATFDLPCPHIMPRPRRLMPVARCPIAFERRRCRGQAMM